MFPEELKKTLGDQEFCRFVRDIETEDAEGMIVFASDNAKERLLKSPNWLLRGEPKTFSVGFFKKVRI